MWQSGTAPPRRDIWVLGVGVTDELTEAQGLYQLKCLGPWAPGTSGLWWVSLLGPSSHSGETGLMEFWNVRFWDSGEGLALPLQGKV